MVDASGPEFSGPPLGSGETKVGDSDSLAIIEAEHILWLEISVIYTHLVTVLYGTDHLKEDILDQIVVSQVGLVVKDLGE